MVERRDNHIFCESYFLPHSLRILYCIRFIFTYQCPLFIEAHSMHLKDAYPVTINRIHWPYTSPIQKRKKKTIMGGIPQRVPMSFSYKKKTCKFEKENI